MYDLSDTFERFEFQPLNRETFYRHFQQEGDVVKQWYQWWVEDFNWSSCRFYRAQYDRHLHLEFYRFNRLYCLKVRYPEELGNTPNAEANIEAWQNWAADSESLVEHRQARDCLIDFYSKPDSSVKVMRSSSIVQTLMEQIATDWDLTHKRQAKALWFNQVIPAPDARTLRHRQSMPYDEYLWSSHWRQVRAALMLIQKAQCVHCGDASFYGEGRERELHAHHHHYENRGRERYEDLSLLCKQHHKLEHELFH